MIKLIGVNLGIIDYRETFKDVVVTFFSRGNGNEMIVFFGTRVNKFKVIHKF